MKIALAQLNPTIGDIAGNLALVERALAQAEQAECDLLVCSELLLTGYPPRDLLERPECLPASDAALAHLTKRVAQCAVVIGHIARNPAVNGPPLVNRASLIHRGRVVASRDKTLLPNYDIFDEARYFAPAMDNPVIVWNGHRIALTICEDLWDDAPTFPQRGHEKNLVQSFATQHCDLIINLAASPYERDKPAQRLRVLQRAAHTIGAPLIYVNQVGANDHLIFDGGSLALDAQGKMIAQAEIFAEDLLIVPSDIITGDGRRGPPEFASSRISADEASNAIIAAMPKSGEEGGRTRHRVVAASNTDETLASALTLGIRDYVRKCGFQKIYLGLSGGIDSAVVAVLAARALGPNNVTGVCMPSHFSSAASLTDAQALTNNLQIACVTHPIGDLYDAARTQVGSGRAVDDPDVAEENLQARLRGMILMTLANRHQALVLTTGNKSELAVGYCTLYGDLCGALAPLADVTKTRVYALAHHLNREQRIIPESTLTKIPSAELRPHQTDQDSLPPYEQLDAIIEGYIERQQPPEMLIDSGLPRDVVLRVLPLIQRNEYKRTQAPVGLKVTRKAFGNGRRLPVAMRWGV